MITRFLETIRHLPTPKVVFDVGSFDAQQSIEFSETFPEARIYAFECNPVMLPACYQKTRNYPNITVVPLAVHNYDGVTKFYPTNPEKTITPHPNGNQGACSLFRANGAYDHVEKYVQDEIEVPCTRLDTWAATQGITQVDLIWMDLQGAELLALEGMGNLLKTVRAIHTEVEIRAIYTGQCLWQDVHNYLTQQGFELRYYDQFDDTTFGMDVIYLRAVPVV